MLTGLRAWPEFAAKIAAIPTSDHFRARFSTFVLPATKFESSGKNGHTFTNWHQRVGKRTTQASPTLFKQNRQRMPQTSKLPMPGPSYANKAGHGCCKKVYEVDPFICPKCQDPKELTEIIDWANTQEREQRVTVCARSPPELSRASV